MTPDIIYKYFPQLTEEQRTRIEALEGLYTHWNAMINVISRKDIGNLYAHHVLHSMGIAKVIRFRPDTSVLDVGTGGGFPGLPLAILFPDVSFVLIDSVGKKVKVASAVAAALELGNVEVLHRNVVEERRRFDFIVSRAVMGIPELVRLVQKNVARAQHNALPNGLLCLKGGDLSAELRPFPHTSEVWELSDYFKEEYYAGKKLAYVQL